MENCTIIFHVPVFFFREFISYSKIVVDLRHSLPLANELKPFLKRILTDSPINGLHRLEILCNLAYQLISSTILLRESQT